MTVILRRERDVGWVVYPYNDFRVALATFETEKEARKFCRDNNHKVSWVWIAGR